MSETVIKNGVAYPADSILKDDGIRVIESNEDILLSDTGHIPDAVHIDWRADLQDPGFLIIFHRKNLRGFAVVTALRQTPLASSTATRRTGGRVTRFGHSGYLVMRK